ncbi:MAG TPA: hypothetical protein VL025_05180 [Thermoanaerobaculia bacterium]|nr:hypothetical protein [Thermoanaerobaculia bacterium]
MKKRSRLAVLMVLLAVVGVVTSPPPEAWAFCGMSFCSSVSHCWENCPDATTAACVNNVCQYTYGGPTPPNPQTCPSQRFCGDASHCDYGSVQGSCINNVCVC